MTPMDGRGASPPPVIGQIVRHYRNMARGPYRVDEALEEAKQADETSIERILVETSESAWLAYYSMTKTSEMQRGFAGKAEFTRFIEDLRSQDTGRWREFARPLASEVGTEKVNISGRAAKRRLAPARPTTTTSSTDTHPVDDDNCVPEPTPGELYIGAPLRAAKELFHTQFWESIERIPNPEQPNQCLANISMAFHQDDIRDQFGCQMEIGIAANKVAHLAFEYFEAKVEPIDGVRLVCLPGGGKYEPDPSMKLRACRHEFFNMLRGDLYDGVRESPIYQREERELRDRTDGVSMTISNRANECGKITLYLGEWRASRIKNMYGT
ncbi:hypothetical protein FDECE_18053 [Fusarium decemcellulare]|nr:hypothetical protein FDECE_18053 [Fusarium decemcellulare]